MVWFGLTGPVLAEGPQMFFTIHRKRWQATGFMLLAGAFTAVVPVLVARAASVPQPIDQPYPGLLGVQVDLRDAPKRIFRVTETIPVSPGPLALHYPEWIPGEHAPSGPINNVAGLFIRANGKQLPWRRDLTDIFTLHLTVPEGVQQLDLSFQFLSPGDGGQFGSGPSTSNDLAVVEFNQVAFYPAGYYASRIRIKPSVTLPQGWQFASAMEVAAHNGNVIQFKPMGFDAFIDSPLITGRHFRRVDLDPGANVPVYLNIVGDSAADIEISKQQIGDHRKLVDQVYALFHSKPFRHYDFLLTLSDKIDHFGLEHHQSSDDRLPADALTNDTMYQRVATLMPHEWVHAWNGKFRRPAKLWTPNFNVPMQDDMLWVYEGLTDYWAGVLTARSGMWTSDQYHDAIASIAAAMSHRTGREWRSLQDTADGAPLSYSGASGWSNWRRRADFYPEGQLLWLDVDTRIRELSHDRRSLDDFARSFFAVADDNHVTRTYTWQDMVDGLNAVQTNDWADFLRTRLDYTGDTLPEKGLQRAGWEVVYKDTPSDYDKAMSHMGSGANLAYSIGLSVGKSGQIWDVQWDGPAFRAGLVSGMSIVAVNGKTYSAEVLTDAVAKAQDSKAPITLLVKNIDIYSSAVIDYHGGLKYPHLQRIKSSKDLLVDILAARKRP